MISNLQILRGLAAVGVVFYHIDFRLPGDWHTEFFGVSTFFVFCDAAFFAVIVPCSPLEGRT